jgi:hypothetical protein
MLSLSMNVRLLFILSSPKHARQQPNLCIERFLSWEDPVMGAVERGRQGAGQE